MVKQSFNQLFQCIEPLMILLIELDPVNIKTFP